MHNCYLDTPVQIRSKAKRIPIDNKQRTFPKSKNNDKDKGEGASEQRMYNKRELRDRGTTNYNDQDHIQVTA